jgi:hypothetical protein
VLRSPSVGEPGLGHAEAQFAGFRRVALGRREPKARPWVDEAPDQPG